MPNIYRLALSANFKDKAEYLRMFFVYFFLIEDLWHIKLVHYSVTFISDVHVKKVNKLSAANILYKFLGCPELEGRGDENLDRWWLIMIQEDAITSLMKLGRRLNRDISRLSQAASRFEKKKREDKSVQEGGNRMYELIT